MPITAAAIEANGWVLRLTLTGSLGSFAGYTLDPDGSPRVQLSSSHSGYAPSGGTAAAVTLARSLVATKPLRKPVAASNAGVVSASVVDETDLGGGSIQVRLALNEHVYATDTALSLSVAAGWRTGEGAATVTVSNGSTTVAPIPIMRWADTPYRRATGAFDLELVAFSHHPSGLQPVAGVKFTVTDGTTVKTYWATALATSPRHGDGLRCYRVTVDPATATALTAGLLRCDAEVYPWLGSMRSTDTAGTRSMTGLGTGAFATGAASPFTIAWDPASARYGERWICVDPAGTTTAASVTVAASWGAAKAGTRAANLSTAIQAGYLNNRALAIANGQPAKARSVDALQIGLVAGTHSTSGATTITTGVTADESWCRVFGDPDNADPRANVVLQTASGTAGFRLGRMMLNTMTLEVGSNTLSSGFPTYWAFDNIEVRGKTGQETNAVYPASATPPAGQAVLWVTATRYWRSGSAIEASSGFRPGLVRACEFSRRADAITLLTSKWLTDSTVTGAQTVVAGWQQTLGDLGSQEDAIIAGCDLRATATRAWTPARLNAALAGTAIDSTRRQVFANNVVERFGSDPQPFWSMGEDDLTQLSYNIIEGNSFVGERSNILYSDPLPATLAETDSQTNLAFVNRVANNAFDWAATKHDSFDDPTSKSVRAAASDPRAHGYRPQAVGCWSSLYGVGFEANIDFGRHASAGNFQFEYFGRRSVQMVGGAPGYASDRSKYGTNAGGGDYKPAVGSLLIGRGLASNFDRDRGGVARAIPFAAGAIDTAANAVLSPSGGLHASRAGTTAIVWAATLFVAGARSVSRSGSPALGWSGMLAPGAAQSVCRAGATSLGWTGGLSPQGSVIASSSAVALAGWSGVVSPEAGLSVSRAGVSAIGWAGLLVPAASLISVAGLVPLLGAAVAASLVPGGGRMPVHDGGSVALPGGLGNAARTLVVTEDARTRFVSLS